MTATPGPLEHQSKVASIIQELFISVLVPMLMGSSVHWSLTGCFVKRYHTQTEVPFLCRDLSPSVITAKFHFPPGWCIAGRSFLSGD